MVNKITIKSNNPDFKGTWKKSDIESEMKDLDMEIMTSNDWIEFLIMGHLFDDKYSKDIQDALTTFINYDCIEEMKIRGNDFWARLIKEK